MLLSKREFEERKQDWEKAFLKTCDGDPKTFPEANYKMEELVKGLNFKDDNEKNEFFSVVETFKDTDDVLALADKNFERYYKERTKARSKDELYVFFKCFPAYQKTLLSLIENFKTDFDKLNTLFTDYILIDCNDFICDDYPFSLSFGDHNIFTWVESIQTNLKNKWLDMKESVKNSFKTKEEVKYNTQFLEELVSYLNNSMEKDSEYYMDLFGCERDEIIDSYGFGYDKEGELDKAEGDSLIPIAIPKDKLKELYNFFKDKPLEDSRIFIEWLTITLD